VLSSTRERPRRATLRSVVDDTGQADLIRAYASGVARLDRESALAISVAARQIAGGLRTDALERCARILREHGSPQPSTLAPTMLGLMDLVPDEPRFSLLLAALLDPSRTGAVAHAIWPPLADVLGEPTDSPARDPSWRARLQVLPSALGAEYHHFDVWARVPDGRGHRLALLIENKIGAPERPFQLRDYHNRIGALFGDDATAKTRFVFLTPDGRSPDSAGDSLGVWQRVSWSQLADALRRGAGTLASGSAGGRLLHEVISMLKRYTHGFDVHERLATIGAATTELERADLDLDTIARFHATAVAIERALPVWDGTTGGDREAV
jgi:hypothetical protein